MKRRIALLCAVILFAATAEASHVKIAAAKGRFRTDTGTAYTVTNDEDFPVDVCLSDTLTGLGKIEVSPFTLERFDHGQWMPQAGSEATVHFTYELRPTWVESYPITVREAGRYRLVLVYGRAAPDGKGCDAFFHNLTQTVRSHAFNVQ